MTFWSGDRALARDNPGLRTSVALKAAKRLKAPPRLRTPHEVAAGRGQSGHLPFTAPSAPFGSDPTPSFSSFPNRSSYAAPPFAPNPLVSSPYKATPEYDYLYTPTLILGSPPPSRSYSYRADNSYLLRPSPAYQVAAWSYQWKRSPANQTAVRAIRSASPRNEPATSRNPGQKIDNGLGSRAMFSREGGGLWRPSPTLGGVRLDRVAQDEP